MFTNGHDRKLFRRVANPITHTGALNLPALGLEGPGAVVR